MIKAVRDYVVVKPIYKKETIGGLVLADGAEKKEGEYYGVVLSVGPEYQYDLNPGEKVLFRKNEGVEIETEDRRVLLVLKSQWVVAKIEEI